MNINQDFDDSYIAGIRKSEIPYKPLYTDFEIDEYKLEHHKAFSEKIKKYKSRILHGLLSMVSAICVIWFSIIYYNVIQTSPKYTYNLIILIVSIPFIFIALYFIQVVTIILPIAYGSISDNITEKVFSKAEIIRNNQFDSALCQYNDKFRDYEYSLKRFHAKYPDSKSYGNRIEEYLDDRNKRKTEYERKQNAALQQKQEWFALNGYQFEIEITKLFIKMGYHAERTVASGDGGIDIILHDVNENRIIVQCKNHKNPVGPSIVRELYGVMVAEKAKKAILICSGGFTEGVHNFAKGKPIDLWDINKVLEMHNKFRVDSSMSLNN